MNVTVIDYTTGQTRTTEATGPSLDFTLDDVAALDPWPRPAAPTRAYQPNAKHTRTGVTVRPEPNMLQAALWYAKRGWHVFPIHAPIFNARGHCTGCTCEAWKRTQHRYGPNYKCPQPGKCPAVKWADKATTAPEQIRKWWGHKWKSTNVDTGATVCYTPNIGIACGQSNLLIWDRDTYKDGYADIPTVGIEQRQTVTSLTGSGGEQLIYAMQGKSYSNATGDLPYGNDIRGAGGYIVAPPSLHKSGRRYQFEEGYNPTEIELKPIPLALQTILDAAQETSIKAQAVTFTAPTTDKPDLIRWHISKNIRELIHNPKPVGQRSNADHSVCLSLIYADATNDEILAVFQHNLIGTAGKYAESGDGYLARTIGKARAYAELHPRPDVDATIAHMRLWIKTRNLADCLPAGPGSKKVRLVVDAVFDAMQAEGGLSVTIGKKRLAKLAGVSPNTVVNVLALLNGRLFNVTPTEYGATIELPAATLVVDCRLQKFDPLLSSITYVYKRGGQKIENDKNEYSPHKADDEFASGTSRHMKERIANLAQALDLTYLQAKADYTSAGLGEGLLLARDTWVRIGDYTAQEYAEEAGIKLSAARSHLRRAEVNGLATSEREGSRGPKVYSFVSDFWEKVKELAPNLRTYKLSDQRENKRLESAQQWVQQGAKSATTPEEKQKFERRFAKLARQRLPVLTSLYADKGLSQDEIISLAYEVADYKRSPQIEATLRTQRNAQRDDHRETVTMIADLADAISDIGTPLQAVFDEIMKYGVFDPRMVRQVLQSSVQMVNYETVTDVRNRLAKADFIVGMHP